MQTREELGLEELNPFIRKAGIQGNNACKNRFRKIYDHEFLYCCKGKAYANIDRLIHEIDQGKLIYIKPDKNHIIWLDDKEPAEMLWIHFDFTYRKDVYGLNELVSSKGEVMYNNVLPFKEYIRHEIVLEGGIEFPDIIAVHKQEVMEDLFRKAVMSFKLEDRFVHMECKIILLQIFKILIEQIAADSGIVVDKDKKSVSEFIIKYILKNYQKRISLRELSQLVGLSEDYVGKVFARETGTSFVNFVNSVRIKNAMELLGNTDLSVTNVAEIVGFSDVYYFSKVMKKYIGCSPIQWKRKPAK